MSEFNPHQYAYQFTNTDAPAYALEAIENGDITDDDTANDWAHETADSMAAVIYTAQSRALYAAGITSNEDDELANSALSNPGNSADERTDAAITAFAYTWHHRILLETATEALENIDEHTCWIDDTTCTDCGGVA
jgi:hypothetical protein